MGCVGSRPTVAPCALMLAPAFVQILFNKEYKLNYKFSQAIAFVVPVMIGAVGLMYYNYIRFESPFDFGANYQLTVSNINANRVRISVIPIAIFHYLLQLPISKNVFPFFTYGFSALDNYQMYSYIEKNIGALVYPFLLLAVLMLPKAFRSHALEGQTEGRTETSAFVICGYALSLLILWADFCLGGVSVRYAQDFMAMLTVASLIVIMNVVTPERKYMYKGTFFCMLVDIFDDMAVTAPYFNGRASDYKIDYHSPHMAGNCRRYIYFLGISTKKHLLKGRCFSHNFHRLRKQDD